MSIFTFLSGLFRRKPATYRFDPTEVNRVTAERMAEMKSRGWAVPSAPDERPVAGVMHGLGPEFAPIEHESMTRSEKQEFNRKAL